MTKFSTRHLASDKGKTTSRLSSFFHSLLLVALFSLAFFAAGCASLTPPTPFTEMEAARRWKDFEKKSQSSHAPTVCRASIRYTLPEKGGHRLMMTMWSNDANSYRVDMHAGFNSLVASILETPDTFLLFIPAEKTLYTCAGQEKPALSLGRPIPVSPASLVCLLLGKYTDVFGDTAAAPAGSNGDIRYRLAGDAPLAYGTLTLNSRALPVLWKDDRQDAWKIELAYDAESATPDLPERLTISQADGYEAIILVKQRTTPAHAFAEDDFSLSVPPGTTERPFPTR